MAIVYLALHGIDGLCVNGEEWQYMQDIRNVLPGMTIVIGVQGRKIVKWVYAGRCYSEHRGGIWVEHRIYEKKAILGEPKHVILVIDQVPLPTNTIRLIGLRINFEERVSAVAFLWKILYNGLREAPRYRHSF